MERSLIMESSDLISRCKAISAFKQFCKECDGGEACGECKIVDMVQVLKGVTPEVFSLDITVQRPDNLGRIILPKKFRAALNIRQGAALEFMLDERHGVIIIQEYKLDEGRNANDHPVQHPRR